MTQYSTIAIIVAAGRGIRFARRDATRQSSSPRPKQYTWLDGRPLLCHGLDVFLANPLVDAVTVVINQQDKKFYAEAVALCHHHKKILNFVIGGTDRQESVYLGLRAIEKYGAARVLIHDAARPFLPTTLLDRVIKGLASLPPPAAVVPCLSLTGALKEVVDDKIIATHTRQNRFIAQTPQGFDYQKILFAHQQQAGRALDDDAAVWQATYANDLITMVTGDNANIKITTRADLQFVKNVIEPTMQKTTITTLGVDLHRFATEESIDASIMLAGVAIPTKKNIVAHSDGDVVLHALTDAILGALGAGDIGVYFPPQEEKWRGVASAIFVEKAMAMMKEKNATLIHADVTILLEEPRLAPHRALMVKNLSKLLHLREESIGLKVTTTEKMGAIGAGLGIMAMVQTTIVFNHEFSQGFDDKANHDNNDDDND